MNADESEANIGTYSPPFCQIYQSTWEDLT